MSVEIVLFPRVKYVALKEKKTQFMHCRQSHLHCRKTYKIQMFVNVSIAEFVYLRRHEKACVYVAFVKCGQRASTVQK